LLGIAIHPDADKIPKVMDGSTLPLTDEVSPVQNILIWSNDAISRSYFIHNLPKTWAFLDTLLDEKSGKGGFLLRGHNVLGLNSAPNMVPLLTGTAILQ
jgi:hypothetical protein